MREAVLLGIACVIVVVWAIATLVSLFDHDAMYPRGLDIVMPIVATGLFGGAWLAGRKRNRDDDE
jgi:hypothetical protein